MKNYVGVTGVVNISDNILAMNAARSAGFSMQGSHVPMIGFLVIKKTLEGIPPSKGKIPHQRYTPISSLARVMSYSNEAVLNMVHYGVKHDQGLAKDVISIFNRDGIYKDNLCRALQLNLAWPKKSELEKILNQFPEMQIVLQLPKKILEGEGEKEIARKLNNYSKFIQGTIMDPSGGKGDDFNLSYSSKLYSEIKDRNPRLVVCFAGGNNSSNICNRIRDIGACLGSKDFSVDAETGVRIYEKDEDGGTRIDMFESDFARKYFFESRNGLFTIH
ncbi:MAG: hypothetical protein PVJ67_02315 [Candidatus Pacearchaeota archaeon]|jgi:hypothetical protein